MTYNKPMVTVLGDAVRAIRTEAKDHTSMEGNIAKTPDPAYDLDE